MFSTKITKKQASDAGMALVLIFLLIGLFSHNILFFKTAIPILIINMIYPMFFYFFAVVWFGLSHLLGSIVSKILLSLIYAILVIPFGIFRKLIGKDSLMLTQFKKNYRSVFKIRNYAFSSKDIEKPY
ncbi:MAG: hypothetical protein PVI26_05090 [Chitinispirillia bacterium]|jgi:hypothetical protein